MRRKTAEVFFTGSLIFSNLLAGCRSIPGVDVAIVAAQPTTPVETSPTATSTRTPIPSATPTTISQEQFETAVAGMMNDIKATQSAQLPKVEATKVAPTVENKSDKVRKDFYAGKYDYKDQMFNGTKAGIEWCHFFTATYMCEVLLIDIQKVDDKLYATVGRINPKTGKHVEFKVLLSSNGTEVIIGADILHADNKGKDMKRFSTEDASKILTKYIGYVTTVEFQVRIPESELDEVPEYSRIYADLVVKSMDAGRKAAENPEALLPDEFPYSATIVIH